MDKNDNLKQLNRKIDLTNPYEVLAPEEGYLTQNSQNIITFITKTGNSYQIPPSMNSLINNIRIGQNLAQGDTVLKNTKLFTIQNSLTFSREDLSCLEKIIFNETTPQSIEPTIYKNADSNYERVKVLSYKNENIINFFYYEAILISAKEDPNLFDDKIPNLTKPLPDELEIVESKLKTNSDTSGSNILFGDNGTNSNIEIMGNKGRDLIFGGNGSQILKGGADDDVLYGGLGTKVASRIGEIAYNQTYDKAFWKDFGKYVEKNDSDNTADIIFGDQGNDTLYGNKGNDYLIGGGDKDSLPNDKNNEDILDGGDGKDVLIGGLAQAEFDSNNKVVFQYDKALDTETGNDFLIGRLGSDIMQGGDGADFMVGGDAEVESKYKILNNKPEMVRQGKYDESKDNIDKSNDILIGGKGEDTIYGGLGDDILVGGEAKVNNYKIIEDGIKYNVLEDLDCSNDYLLGGEGNDTLIGGEGDDTLDGGKDFDGYIFSSDENIYGAEKDTLIDSDGKGGLIIDAKIISKEFINPVVEGDLIVHTYQANSSITAKYNKQNKELTLFYPNSHSIVINDFENGKVGIWLSDLGEKKIDAALKAKEYWDKVANSSNGLKMTGYQENGHSSITTTYSLGGASFKVMSKVCTGKDPLILDLDGNGIKTLSAFQNIAFDLNNDGEKEKTSWAAPGEGILTIDKNGDGQITSGAELFGDRTVKKDGTTAAEGFDALKDYDDNKDGKIDSSDAVYSQIRVWNDLNSNGLSDTGELSTLNETGIASINLNSETAGFVDENNNIEAARGTYTKTTGVNGIISEYQLARQEIESVTMQINGVFTSIV